ncbi:MAG: flagellin [Betaproteobacteria bacterium]
MKRNRDVSLVVNTNVGSLNAQRSLAASGAELKTAMERLSSGKKINSAADDAAGFAIAERMTAQIRGLNMAVKNVNDGLGFLKVVDGALESSMKLTQRMKELSIQASNGTLSGTDRQYVQKEVFSLIEEIDRIYYQTEYNGDKAFSPFGSGNLRNIQVGISPGDSISIALNPLSAVDIFARAEAFAIWSDAPFISAASTSPPANGMQASSFSISTASGDTIIETSENMMASQIEELVNAKAEETGVFARATTWGFLEATASTMGSPFSLEINGHSVVVDSFSYENLATALNAERDLTGVRAFAYDWGVELDDLKGNDISIEIQGDGRIYAYAPWKYDDKVELVAGGNDSVTWGGSVKFMSSDEFSVDKLGAAVPTLFDTNPRSQEGYLDATLVDNNSLTSYFDQVYGVTENLDGANVQYAAWVANLVSNAALDTIATERVKIGSFINRLEYTVSNLMNVAEFTTSARSRIEDADFAAESARLAKAQVLQQTGTAMLAQANAQPQMILSLIR